MSKGHHHFDSKNTQERALFFALILTATFLIVEVIAGILTESLALISDAAHMFTDVAALTISLVAIKIGRRSADLTRTFGYYRFEILAAMLNTLFLFLIGIYIIYEAYQRLEHPPDIYSPGMVIVGVLGLIINLISMQLLKADQHTNMNMHSAYLEVWSDMLGSVGVMLAAVLIYFLGWRWIDSLVAILIGLWILPRTYILLKESINILLEGVPKEINLDQINKFMCQVDGVIDIHELHVWAISSDKISLTAHVVVDPNYDRDTVSQTIREGLITQFNISHSTLQPERTKCLEGESVCHFSPAKNNNFIHRIS